MARTINSTPRQDGFRMPAEWEPHDGCWLIWPENMDNWRMGAKFAQEKFVEVASVISRSEQVTVAASPRQYRNARARLPEDIRVVEIDHKDAWARDAGATFVINDSGEVRGIDWHFNAYGGIEEGLHFPWDQCELAARKMIEIENVVRYRPDFILEGGSIHVDGQGTLISTEECVLNKNRNPQLSKEEMEQRLRDYLNVESIIWLKNGLFEDETDGHVDNLCCFIKPGVVALAWTDDENDPQYPLSLDALNILQNATDAQGRKLKIIKFPQPAPVIYTEDECRGIDIDEYAEPRRLGDRTSASYINFYIGNSVVVVPFFNDPNDQVVKELLQAQFPDKEVVGVYARDLVVGGGNIHCITQQQPAPQFNK